MRERFVAAYLAQPLDARNATQAAIDAGYSPRSARTAASRLMADDNIRARLAAAQTKILDRYEVTADRVVRELARLGFANMKNYVGNMDLDTMGEDEAAAIKKLTREVRYVGEDENREEIETTTFELCDKIQPLRMLAQHTGLFTEGASDPTHFTLIINIPAERPVINVTPTPARPRAAA